MLHAVMDERLERAVRWANLPGHGHTIAEACARFKITQAAYRKARKELGKPTWSSEELVLAGLSGDGKTVSVSSLIYYYDWIDHSALTDTEMVAILDKLIARGWVRKVGDVGYTLTREWP